MRTGSDPLNQPLVGNFPVDSNDRKHRVIAVHVNVDPADKKQIRTDKVSADNFEGYVEVLPGEIFEVTVDTRVRPNPQQEGRR